MIKFDIEFYKNFYPDVRKLKTNKQIYQHYSLCGYKENRIICQEEFNKLYPDFNLEYYNQQFIKLKWNKYQLMRYYYLIIKNTTEKNIVSNNDIEIIPSIEDLKILETNILILETNILIFDKLMNKCASLKIIIIEQYNFTNIFKHINIENSVIFNEYSNYKKKMKIIAYDELCNTYYNELFFFWIKKSIEDKQISITSPFDNSLIYTDKYFILTIEGTIEYPYTICNYVFNNNIILGLGLGTGEGSLHVRILYIYNIYLNEIYYSWYDYSHNNFKINILPKLYENLITISKYDFKNIKSKITTIYGYMNNMGHMLFNDYTGLYLLHCFNIFKNVDEVIFGVNDVYNIKNYLSKYKKLNIINTLDVRVLNYTIGKGVLFKYNHFFISNRCIHFLKYNLSFNRRFNTDLYNEVYNEVYLIKQMHFPIINIVLRQGSFEMENQDIIISELINMIILKYPNAYFYFDGFCKSEQINDIDMFGYLNKRYSYKELITNYNTLVNSIINKINTKNYKSLINLTIDILIKYIEISNYGIYNIGSACCNSVWICNIPGIQFGRKDIKIYDSMDKIFKENMPNVIYLTNNIIFSDNSFKIEAKTIYDLLPNF